MTAHEWMHSKPATAKSEGQHHHREGDSVSITRFLSSQRTQRGVPPYQSLAGSRHYSEGLHAREVGYRALCPVQDRGSALADRCDDSALNDERARDKGAHSANVYEVRYKNVAMDRLASEVSMEGGERMTEDGL